MNTFQCVLVTDGSLSFVIFLYGEIQWTAASGGRQALVGVNAGDGIQQFSVSESRTVDIINITTTSNVGVPGVWIFQLNGDDISMESVNGNLYCRRVLVCKVLYIILFSNHHKLNNCTSALGALTGLFNLLG